MFALTKDFLNKTNDVEYRWSNYLYNVFNMWFKKFIYYLFLPLINRDIVKKYNFLFLLRFFFGKIFIPKISKIFGHKMFLHKSGHSFELAFLGCYEELETKFIKKINLKNKIVVDVGACIGYYSLLFSEAVGQNGKVISFEPELKNYNILKRNIILNNINNIEAYNIAVGNKNGSAILRISNSPGQHAVFDFVEEDVSKTEVEITRLDDFLKGKVNFLDISFVKVDVEGYEFEVLKGMKNIIKFSSDLIIQLEFAPQHLDEQTFNYQEFINFINENNLRISYWDLQKKLMVDLEKSEWLLSLDVIEKFKLGLVYSRNLILRKKI